MSVIEVIVRSVIVHDGRLLVAKAPDEEHTFLPGGHVETGEGMVDALRRELREELGIECRVGPYLGVVEHAWRGPDGQHFEINHCFIVNCPEIAGRKDLRSLEEPLDFGWVPLSELESRDLRPRPLISLVRGWADGHRGVWWGSTF